MDFFLSSDFTFLTSTQTLTGSFRSQRRAGARKAFWFSAALAGHTGSWQPVVFVLSFCQGFSLYHVEDDLGARLRTETVGGGGTGGGGVKEAESPRWVISWKLRGTMRGGIRADSPIGLEGRGSGAF